MDKEIIRAYTACSSLPRLPLFYYAAATPGKPFSRSQIRAGAAAPPSSPQGRDLPLLLAKRSNSGFKKHPSPLMCGPADRPLSGRSRSVSGAISRSSRSTDPTPPASPLSGSRTDRSAHCSGSPGSLCRLCPQIGSAGLPCRPRSCTSRCSGRRRQGCQS